MNTKKCAKCQKLFPMESFTKDRLRLDGRNPRCLPCQKLVPSRVTGTVEYFRTHVWNSINRRTINGKHPGREKKIQSYFKKGILLQITKEQFWQWCEDNRNTILSYYRLNQTPSIDRIDSNGHYSIENIRIKSYDENRRAGILNASHSLKKKVFGINIKDGSKIQFESLAKAEQYGFSRSKISRVALGKGRSHKGFRWTYEEKKA